MVQTDITAICLGYHQTLPTDQIKWTLSTFVDLAAGRFDLGHLGVLHLQWPSVTKVLQLRLALPGQRARYVRWFSDKTPRSASQSSLEVKLIVARLCQMNAG